MIIDSPFAENLRRTPLLAILRGLTAAEAGPVADALLGAGIRFLEVPLNAPGALDAIRALARQFPDRGLVLGAGTVVKPGQVGQAQAAGASFIVSPNSDPDVIRETKRLGLVSMPGFLTPSEAFLALAHGADLLKLFPASALAPAVIRDLQAVVKAPLVAVGGVTEHNLPDYLGVCAAAGIGSALYRPGDAPAAIATRAARFMTIAKERTSRCC